MRVLWESEYFISENTLTVNVNRLRSKLEDIGLKDLIVTKKITGVYDTMNVFKYLKDSYRQIVFFLLIILITDLVLISSVDLKNHYWIFSI